MNAYYLHVNGDLILKREPDVTDFRESDFVKMFWLFDELDRTTAYTILVCANALGANKERINELIRIWEFDGENIEFYCKDMGIKVFIDGDKYCCVKNDFINLMESPAGFGDTVLDAMSSLALELGYKAQKLWAKKFSF